jgi:hypothetical protein
MKEAFVNIADFGHYPETHAAAQQAAFCEPILFSSAVEHV